MVRNNTTPKSYLCGWNSWEVGCRHSMAQKWLSWRTQIICLLEPQPVSTPVYWWYLKWRWAAMSVQLWTPFPQHVVLPGAQVLMQVTVLVLPRCLLCGGFLDMTDGQRRYQHGKRWKHKAIKEIYYAWVYFPIKSSHWSLLYFNDSWYFPVFKNVFRIFKFGG